MISDATLEPGALLVVRGMSHGFGSELGPETGLSVQIVKEFIAKPVS